MNEQPLVTIIVPCYNHERFIADCLKSFIGQTYDNIEMLIYDDCSTDQSVSIIREFLPELEKRMVRVEFHVNESNLGVTKTVNKGIKSAKGKYIKTLASDDMLAPLGIEQLVNAFEREPGWDILFCNGYYMPEESTYPDVLSEELPLCYTQNPMPETGIFEALYRENFLYPAGLIVKKTTYEKFGMYDETNRVEDWEYSLRIAQRGMIGYINEKLFYYRRVAVSISTLSNVGNAGYRLQYMYSSMLDTMEKYADRAGQALYRTKKGQVYEYFAEAAIKLDLRDKVKEVKKNAKDDKIALSVKCQIKILLYYCNLYKIVMAMKNKDKEIS